MFCPHCGVQVPAGNLFCQKCANPVDPALVDVNAPATPAGKTRTTPKAIGASGWFLIVLLAILYAGIGLALFDGTKLDKNQVGPAVLWTGITLAHFRRRLGHSGWLGFVLGLVLGYGLTFVAAMTARAIRSYS